MSARRRREDRNDDGFSLIELLVTLALFSVLLAVFGAGLSIMFKDVRHQLGQSDDLDASRRVLAQLDKQVRYANAIDTPGTTGTLGGTTWYVEWQSGDAGLQQTCTQWRILPTGEMQSRSWLQPPPSSATTAISGQTAWVTRAQKVLVPVSGSPFALAPEAVRLTTVRQQLLVTFSTAYGAPAVSQTAQVTLTAQNTASSAPLLSSVCGGQRP